MFVGTRRIGLSIVAGTGGHYEYFEKSPRVNWMVGSLELWIS